MATNSLDTVLGNLDHLVWEVMTGYSDFHDYVCTDHSCYGYDYE